MLNTEESSRFLSLRRQIIASRYRQLNPPQQQGVMTTGGALLLLAGAGSGKTTVLIERIANLINFGQGSDSDMIPEEITTADLTLLENYVAGAPTYEEDILRICAVNPCQPWNILAITFTNKAATELKERLEAKLGVKAHDVWACTFHSCCVRILRRDIDKLGFEKNFTIYDTADSHTVIKQAMKELEISEKEFPYRAILGQISRAKDAFYLAKEYAMEAEASGDYYAKIVAKVYGKYQKKLWDAGAVDFDDIILHTVRLLEKCPEVLEYYHNKFHYVLIDEYQDTNQLQYRLATLLASGRKNFCVVGDDDQSIYRFRGATIENILNFEKQNAQTRVIRLEENYRSTKTILDASNAVIHNNRGRKGKKLWTQAEQGDNITYHIADNERDEAHFIANQMMENYSNGTAWRDNVILYRMNAQSLQLEQACKVNGIPYRLVGGTRFFDRAEVKDMLAYLTVLSNPDDDLRLARIINRPPRGIGDKTIGIAQNIVLETDSSLFSVVDNPFLYPELEKSAKKLGEFTSMIGELAMKVDEMPLADFYNHLMDRTGYTAMLQKKDDVENVTRLENIKELQSSISAYVERCDDENPPSLEGFLDEIALFTNLDTHDSESDYVTMMTMHSAKGLEFPVVFIPAMEEGVFPSSRVIGDEAELEEERRLCYVAMTRAKKKLFLVGATQRMLMGRTNYNKTSRFIEEIPSELIDRSGDVRAPLAESSVMAQPFASPFGGEKFGNTPNFASGDKSKKLKSVAKVTAKPAEPLEKYEVGEKVKHTAFGVGTVTETQAMSGDVLMKVEFEVGMKSFLLKTAGKFMTKVEE